MIEKIYDISGAYELFKSYNGVGNENCIFYATYEKALTSKDVAKAAQYMTNESICNESDACFIFDFPDIPEKEQKNITLRGQITNQHLNQKKKIFKHYPCATYRTAGNLGQDKYIEFLETLIEKFCLI